MSTIVNPREKTAICTNFLSGCVKPQCGFAHSLAEIRACQCRFDYRCNNRECEFWHPSKSKSPSNLQLWKAGLKKLFEYTMVGDTINIVKNNINKFNPKKIDDILAMEMGTYEIPRGNDFIIELGEEDDAKIDELEAELEKVKITPVFSDEQLDGDAPLTSDSVNAVIARHDNMVRSRTTTMETFKTDGSVKKISLNFLANNNQYAEICKFMRQMGIEPHIIAIE
jgi:hypothetical protein